MRVSSQEAWLTLTLNGLPALSKSNGVHKPNLLEQT